MSMEDIFVPQVIVVLLFFSNKTVKRGLSFFCINGRLFVEQEFVVSSNRVIQ